MKKIIINKKKLLIVLSISIAIFLLVLLISEIGWAVAMQPKPKRIGLPNELDSIDNQIVEKYKLQYFGIMNQRGVDCILEKDINECKKNRLKENLVFYIDISNIQNKKYQEEVIMTKEADSINDLIQRHLPHKDCIDSLYIYISALDTISDKYIYDKVLKYPVKN